MKITFLSIALLFLSACIDDNEQRHNALMDRIERQVRLPAGAGSWDRYSRYYALTTKGKVHAIYLYSSAAEVWRAERCYDQKDRRVPCPRDAKNPTGVESGTRIWVDDWEKLPFTDDGNCTVIEFVFDPRSAKFDQPICNGPLRHQL